jgi:hypothetical protein
LIAAPDHRLPDTAQVQVLFAEARRRRRRRRLAAAVASLTVACLAAAARSLLPFGFAQGAAFSPDGTRLAVFERTVAIDSSCCANSSIPAIVNTRTGAVRPVRAAPLVTQEDAGWILWLPGGTRLLAGALSYSYAVDSDTYAARPFFFYPQSAEGPEADHDIMDTPDVNFSAILLPPAGTGRTP